MHSVLGLFRSCGTGMACRWSPFACFHCALQVFRWFKAKGSKFEQARTRAILFFKQLEQGGFGPQRSIDSWLRPKSSCLQVMSCVVD